MSSRLTNQASPRPGTLAMPFRFTKGPIFVLVALNSITAALYFNYLFFYMESKFAFGNRENLLLCASAGLLYAFAAWFGGKFGQRHGYFFTLRTGFAIELLALLVGPFVPSVAGQCAVLYVWTAAICLTWPALEALACEFETPSRLQRMVGIYNIVWAVAVGLAYFSGGALLEKWGLTVIFWAPAGVLSLQLLALAWMGNESAWADALAAAHAARPPESVDHSEQARSPVSPRTFLKMAWLANPFAYVAINAIVPVIPTLAKKLGLSPMFAGFFCSVWFFARAAAFVWLWQWPGWHYRFRWLAAAYGSLLTGFTIILLATNLWLLLAAQILFGLALGLLYYSSLYYSMDAGDAKGEHGGVHEAAIGAGIFGGPAMGAASLYLLPNHPQASTWAVSALLLLGFGGLARLRWRRESRSLGKT